MRPWGLANAPERAPQQLSFDRRIGAVSLLPMGTDVLSHPYANSYRNPCTIWRISAIEELYGQLHVESTACGTGVQESDIR